MNIKEIDNRIHSLDGEIVRINTSLSTIEMNEKKRDSLLNMYGTVSQEIAMIEAYRQDMESDKATYEEKLLREIEISGIDSVYTQIPWYEQTIEALDKQITGLKHLLDDIKGQIRNLDSSISHKEMLEYKKDKIEKEIRKLTEKKQQLLTSQGSNPNIQELAD